MMETASGVVGWHWNVLMPALRTSDQLMELQSSEPMHLHDFFAGEADEKV